MTNKYCQDALEDIIMRSKRVLNMHKDSSINSKNIPILKGENKRLKNKLSPPREESLIDSSKASKRVSEANTTPYKVKSGRKSIKSKQSLEETLKTTTSRVILKNCSESSKEKGIINIVQTVSKEKSSIENMGYNASKSNNVSIPARKNMKKRINKSVLWSSKITGARRVSKRLSNKALKSPDSSSLSQLVYVKGKKNKRSNSIKNKKIRVPMVLNLKSNQKKANQERNNLVANKETPCKFSKINYSKILSSEESLNADSASNTGKSQNHSPAYILGDKITADQGIEKLQQIYDNGTADDMAMDERYEAGDQNQALTMDEDKLSQINRSLLNENFMEIGTDDSDIIVDHLETEENIISITPKECEDSVSVSQNIAGKDLSKELNQDPKYILDVCDENVLENKKKTTTSIDLTQQEEQEKTFLGSKSSDMETVEGLLTCEGTD